MFQVIYEYTEAMPDHQLQKGSIQIDVPSISAQIAVSPDEARRRANGYLSRYVAMALQASEPRLILGDRDPMWRLSMDLILRPIGKVASLGYIEVDAQTREVTPLSPADIEVIHAKVNAIATSLTPTPTTAS